MKHKKKSISPETAFRMIDSAFPCLPGHQMVDAFEEFIRLATQVPGAKIIPAHTFRPVARKLP